MAKHTLKILKWTHHKIFKYAWQFFNIIRETVKVDDLLVEYISGPCQTDGVFLRT